MCLAIRLVSASILLAFVEHDHAKDLVPNHTTNAQEDKFAKTNAHLFYDSVVESLNNSVHEIRAQVPFLHQMGLDHMTLAKPAHFSSNLGPNRFAHVIRRLQSKPPFATMRNNPHVQVMDRFAFGGMCVVTREMWNRISKRVPDAARFPSPCAAMRQKGILESTAAFLPSKDRYRSLCVTLTIGCSIVSYTGQQAHLGPIVALMLWVQLVGFALHWFQLYDTLVGVLDVGSLALAAFIFLIVLSKVSVLAVGGHLLIMALILWNYFENLQKHPYTQRQTYMHYLQHLLGVLTNLHFICWIRTPDFLAHLKPHVLDLFLHTFQLNLPTL